MECQVVQVVQGSEEWEALRRCRITASRIGDVMANPKTKRYQKYRSEIVCELSGIDPESRDEPWFQHGKEMEPRALQAYEYKFGGPIIHDIFMIHHRYEWMSASPDFMTTDYREGGEIKCRKLFRSYLDHVADIKKRVAAGKPGIPPEHRWQVQTAMWLTGLDSWWYVNYHESEGNDRFPPRRKISRIQVARDDKIISDIEARATQFMRECRQIAGLAV